MGISCSLWSCRMEGRRLWVDSHIHIRGCSAMDIDRIASGNAVKLFGLHGILPEAEGDEP